MSRTIAYLIVMIFVLFLLGCTSERLSARLAWVGAALLSLTVGLWSVL